MTELQQNICHTDELAKHKHATKWNADPLKHEKPETLPHRAEYYMYLITQTVQQTYLI